MINNTPKSKLDETVKNTLNNFEAQYDAADWSRMESMLDAAPKSSPFKWSYVITVVIAVALIGGGYAIYNTLSAPKTNPDVTATPPPPAEKKTVPTPPPAVVKTPVAAPPTVQPEAPPAENAVATEIKTPEKSTPAPEIAKNKAEEKKIAANDKNKVSKKPATNNEPIIEHHDKIIGMGNEPIFGDMLDSSKGIVGETREKEETKKAAKAKKDTPVGWDKFMMPNVNPDSLRKYREKRDSLKSN